MSYRGTKESLDLPNHEATQGGVQGVCVKNTIIIKDQIKHCTKEDKDLNQVTLQWRSLAQNLLKDPDFKGFLKDIGAESVVDSVGSQRFRQTGC